MSLHAHTHTQTPTCSVSISTLANVLSALLAAISAWTKCLLVLAVPSGACSLMSCLSRTKWVCGARDADESASRTIFFPRPFTLCNFGSSDAEEGRIQHVLTRNSGGFQSQYWTLRSFYFWHSQKFGQLFGFTTLSSLLLWDRDLVLYLWHSIVSFYLTWSPSHMGVQNTACIFL